MNFLEQLAAEWYEYKGYFIRTNIRFGRNATGRGGNVGEIDVIAYKPETQEFIHIESSTDSNSWAERKVIFERKFTDARKYYQEIFPFKTLEIKPKQIAIVGFNVTPIQDAIPWKSISPEESPLGDIIIEVIFVPDFVKRITNELKLKNPVQEAVPEGYPLLRAIQYSSFFNR